jgi:hypothetical protein
MSNATAPLLQTIEPDDDIAESKNVPSGRINTSSSLSREQIVLTPSNHAASGNNVTPNELESG